MPATPEETELLLQLHADAGAGAGWGGVLGRLAALTRAGTAALLAAPAGGAVALLGQHGPGLAEATAPGDPLGLLRMRPERVHAGGDLPGGVVPDAPLRAMAVRASAGGMAWLLVARTPGAPEFRAVDGVLLSTLAPHLPQALALADRLARTRAHAALQDTLAARLGLGWLAFDPEGRVLAHDPAAARLLDGVARLRPGQRLALPDQGAEAALARALERARTKGAAAAALRGGALGLLVMAANGMGPPGATLIGALRGPPPTPPDPALVAQTFGLPLAQARLAMALAQGASLREAAGTLGVTEETARSYSRAIFARTGWRGQPDLMRALLTSAVWLAPPGAGPSASAR